MKRILVLILSFYIALAPAITNAGTLGGWTYSNPVSKGASAVITATKNVVINGKDFIKTGTATITPTAAQVAKTFGKTAGALALTVAIQQMLGAVDWVIEDGSVVTKSQGYKAGSYTILCSTNTTCSITNAIAVASSSTDYITLCKQQYGDTHTIYSGNQCTNKQPPYKVDSYAFQIVLDKDTEQKPISTYPLSTFSQRVIDNAKTGEPKAQAAIIQAATDILAEAETDTTKARPITNQLEQSAETKPADAVDALKQNTGTAKTVNPDGSVAESEFEMPVACTWMPLVCQAASVVITKPQEWADAVVDWVAEKDVPAKSTQDINLPDTPTTPKTVNVNWGSQCPEPTTTTITFMGQSKDLQIIRYDFICEWAWVVKASVVALASIGAVFIIAGRKT